MRISVEKPELEKFIADAIKAGSFATPTEVIEAGLARLMLDPPPEALSAEDESALDEAEAQLERGEGEIGRRCLRNFDRNI